MTSDVQCHNLAPGEANSRGCGLFRACSRARDQLMPVVGQGDMEGSPNGGWNLPTYSPDALQCWVEILFGYPVPWARCLILEA